jgi:lambda family phage portal protein
MHEGQVTAAVEAYRDARTAGGEIGLWTPRNVSADAAVLKDAPKLRARARDLVRNNPHAKNAVRMNRDAVSGSGLKLSLKIDWRTLGIKDIETASEWQDHVTREWEAYAESIEMQADARRQRTFSQLFQLIDQTDYVDGESLAIVEMKPGLGVYQTCLNVIDVDRLSTPAGTIEGDLIRGGIERDPYGEPIAYHIRVGHPADVGLSINALVWQRVERRTIWGRPIVLHVYDQTRPEMTRGVTEFASIITTSRMLADYNETELNSAISRASYAAVIKTELDWTSAMGVIGAKGGTAAASGNPIFDKVADYLKGAGAYHDGTDITWRGSKIPHLLPNESLEVIKSDAANANFAEFEKAFIRHLAAGLGVEAHELAKNYADVNYSAARAALLSVWRTYKARRTRLVASFAMPFFGAWLEEAVAIGTVPLPPGVADFVAARPYLVRGTFIAWGKPMIDPMKERQAQQLGMTMGVDTMEDVCADDGVNWRDRLDQAAYERAYKLKLGLDPDATGPEMAGAPIEDDAGGEEASA